MKYIKVVAALALGALVYASCKKDEDSTTTYKSLSGDLSVGVELPVFVNPGDQFIFKSSGVEVPDSETDAEVVRVYTYKNSEDNVKDTIDTYSVTIPDIVGEYTITATAEAKGYYTKTKKLTTTVVSQKSLTECDRKDLPQIVDARDSKRYRITTINGKSWLAENLAYYQKDEDGKYLLGSSYYSVKATDDIMGGFYTWEDAIKACPEGWRIPTVSEWDSLGGISGDMMCDAYYNGERLWEFWPEVKKTNKYKLYIMPFGYATLTDKEYSFTGFNDYAFYWADDNGNPVCKYIFVSTPKVLEWGDVSKTDFAAQIRCIKE